MPPRRANHERWLLELTGIPTASAREDRVIEWVAEWTRRRQDLALRRDEAGNVVITRQGAPRRRPLYFTAHLDHPAFVVREAPDGCTVELEFRGGVHDPYFDGARIEIFDAEGAVHRATVERLDAQARPFKRVTARLSRPAALRGGEIARWAFRGRGGAPVIDGGWLYAPACDDLAGVAGALAALDVLRRGQSAAAGVLLTRAEEIGFVGAAAACRNRAVPADARLICLENSRSYPESPIGGGPILRVGDRLTVFSPALTNRLSLIMRDYQAAHAGVRAQRKLMPGGVCEASTFGAYGWEATCVCLPLGNYHNMTDIDAVLAGKRPARTGPEYIAVDDYHGMIELLVHFARRIDEQPETALVDGMEKRYRRHAGLL